MADLQVLVVDDEPLARRGLIRILAGLPGVRVVGEAVDGHEAVAGITALTPDLVFLDVQMPELDGIGVVRALGDAMPAVVFVTAFDRYAVEAFDLHAVDYVLKPFDEDRVRLATERARQRLGGGPDAVTAAQLRALVDQLAPRPRLDRFMVRIGARTVVVEARDVDWIEAAGNYVRLHVAGRRHVVRQRIAQLDDELDPLLFARIHRSAIVNLTRVAELVARPSGDWEVILKGGARLVLSRRYREAFEARVARPRG